MCRCPRRMALLVHTPRCAASGNHGTRRGKDRGPRLPYVCSVCSEEGHTAKKHRFNAARHAVSPRGGALSPRTSNTGSLTPPHIR